MMVQWGSVHKTLFWFTAGRVLNAVFRKGKLKGKKSTSGVGSSWPEYDLTCSFRFSLDTVWYWCSIICQIIAKDRSFIYFHILKITTQTTMSITHIIYCSHPICSSNFCKSDNQMMWFHFCWPFFYYYYFIGPPFSISEFDFQCLKTYVALQKPKHIILYSENSWDTYSF